MPSPLRLAAALILACLLSVAARAADPGGIWSWEQTVAGKTRESKLTLILKGKRVVGSLTSPGLRGEITVAEVLDGLFDGDVVEFRIERDLNGQKLVSRFRGKVIGNMISGTMEVPGSFGVTLTRDWNARRVM